MGALPTKDAVSASEVPMFATKGIEVHRAVDPRELTRLGICTAEANAEVVAQSVELIAD